MKTVIFCQSSIFHLYRLGNLVFANTGTRHRLSDEFSMLMLIKECASSNEPCIQRQFAAFLSTVDDQTTTVLLNRKILPQSYFRTVSVTNVA